MQKKSILLFMGFAIALSAGCAVPQPRGEGKYTYVQEPMTKAWYNLYLPVDYVKNNGRHPNPKMKRWPLVMTFHGMKPYDNALPQEREWEKQADIYGYIVCAPELHTSDSFMEYPLTKEHEYVLEDRRNVLAIMDHIFATTYADPKKVLSTSWSCGGYLAHYFPNRFPDRFSCIATRLSNFCDKIMIEDTVPIYRDKIPVAVFIGDGDFPACKYESEEAVAWYTARGFRVVRGKMIDNMGHRRIPQTAAAFFAEQLGLEPLRPLDAAKTVAQVQMTEYYPTQDMIAKHSPPSGLAFASAARSDGRKGNPVAPVTPPLTPPTARNDANNRSQQSPPKPAFASATAGSKYPSDRRPKYDPSPNSDDAQQNSKKPVQAAPSNQPKLASADKSRNNWLEPNKSSPPDKPAPANQSPPNQSKPPAAANEKPKSSIASADPSGRSNAKPTNPAPKPTDKKQTTGAPSDSSKVASASKNPTTKQPQKEPTQQLASNSKPNTQFNPQNAGRPDYDRLMESRPRESGRPPSTPAQGAPRTAGSTNGNVTLAATPRAKALRANVRISGPAIGTAPHYLRYSVDLPRDKIDGADFLWMDNGVWMGDESSGAKILESPGLHFITVLVVTRDDVEYRGQAKVQVLERAPTASTYRPADRTR